MRNDRTAFTLIELLVVISIIAILAAILLPTVNLVRSQAKQTVCRSQMKQVITSFIAYRIDNEGMYPVFGDSWAVSGWWNAGIRWQNLIDPYLGNYRLLNCPVAAAVYPNWNVVDQQTGWVPRGCAPGGNVCNSAVNSKDWIRYAYDASILPWYNATVPFGPMMEIQVESGIKKRLSTARMDRCPIAFDGTWQNDGGNQQGNSWKTYFPHRLYANMCFNDGHLEAVRQSDVTSWDPLQVADK